MNRSALIGLVIIFVVLLSVGVSGSTAPVDTVEQISPGESESAQTDQLQTTTQPTDTGQDFDSTSFEITVHENGSATWTFQYERNLDGNETEDAEEPNDADAFEAWADDFESEETELYTGFVNRAENLTESGTENAGREMEATNFDRSASVEQEGMDQTGNETGVVEMSFVWEGFAAIDDDGTIRVGDVFNEWVLIEDQSLTVKSDDGLEFQSVQEDGNYHADSLEDANRVTWDGRMEFETGEPRIILDDTDGTNSGSIEGASESIGDAAASPLLVIALVIAALAGAGMFARYRGSDDSSTATTTTEETQSPDPTPARTEPTEGIQKSELLTDEDRIVTLIKENGGRMKQVNIVDETGWSKSKVSMLLSEMEDDGIISKLRVGRENIISLEGHEPEATKSPFEE